MNVNDDLMKHFTPENQDLMAHFTPDPSVPGLNNSDMSTAILRGAEQGLTLGQAPKLIGAGNALGRVISGQTPLDPNEIQKAYSEERRASEDNFKATHDAHPYIMGAGDLIGGGKLFGAAMEGAQALGMGRTAAAVGSGAALGSAQGALDGGSVGDMVSGATLGAAGGALGEGASKLIEAAPSLAKKALSTLGPSEEAIARYSDNPDAINKAGTFPQLGQKLSDTLKDLKSMISKDDGAALNTLSKDHDVPKASLLDSIKSIQDKYDVGGATIGDAQNKAFGVLDRASKQLMGVNPGNPNVSEYDLKKIVQALDKNIDWDKPGEDVTNHALESVRTQLDSILKSKNPEYAQAMEPVAKNSDLLSKVSKLFRVGSDSTTDTTASKLSTVLGDNKGVSQNTLSSLKDATGDDYIQSAKDIDLSKQFDSGSGLAKPFYGSVAGGLAGSLIGHHAAGAAVGAGVGALADKYGGDIVKKAIDFSKFVQSNAQQLGPYVKPLTDAMNRGEGALAATHYILQQTDPTYRNKIKELEGLNGHQE